MQISRLPIRLARLSAAFFAITSHLPVAQAQTPWATMPGAPNFLPRTGNFGPTVSTIGITSPAANVLWAVTREDGYHYVKTAWSRTTDNGQTWQTTGLSYGSSSTTFSGNVLYDYSVLDTNTAWVLTRNYDGSGNGVVRFTTNGPSGLVAIPGTLPAAFSTIHFFDAATGIALAPPGNGSTTWGVYRTTTAGATWSAVATPTLVAQTNSWLTAKEAKGSKLWVGTDSGNVLYTNNNGLAWSSSVTGLGEVSGLAFRDSLNGVAYTRVQANRRQLARTVDGGRTWSLNATPWPADVTTIATLPIAGGGTALTYIGAGAGIVATSSDDGLTWQTQLSDNISYWRLATNNAGQLWAATFEPTPTAMLLRYVGNPLAVRTTNDNQVTAYPNPTTGMLHLLVRKDETVRVYNSIGQLCECPVSTNYVDFSACPDGVYLIVIQTQTGLTNTHRIIVRR